VRWHISNDNTVRNENCQKHGALKAGENYINANADEIIEILAELLAEGEIVWI
jgi:hypothetical protein